MFGQCPQTFGGTGGGFEDAQTIGEMFGGDCLLSTPLGGDDGSSKGTRRSPCCCAVGDRPGDGASELCDGYNYRGKVSVGTELVAAPPTRSRWNISFSSQLVDKFQSPLPRHNRHSVIASSVPIR